MDKNQTSDQEVQQKAAIFLQMAYIFCEVILAFPLFIIGLIAVANPTKWNHVEAGNATDDIAQGSYIAMLVVGILLLILLAYSIYVLYLMYKERRAKTGLSLRTANLTLGSLNFLAFVLIRESHGIFTKRKQRKLAKKPAKKKPDLQVQSTQN